MNRQLSKLIRDQIQQDQTKKIRFDWSFEAGKYKCKLAAAVGGVVGAVRSYVSHETNANGLFSNTSYSGPAIEGDPAIAVRKSK